MPTAPRTNNGPPPGHTTRLSLLDVDAEARRKAYQPPSDAAAPRLDPDPWHADTARHDARLREIMIDLQEKDGRVCEEDAEFLVLMSGEGSRMSSAMHRRLAFLLHEIWQIWPGEDDEVDDSDVAALMGVIGEAQENLEFEEYDLAQLLLNNILEYLRSIGL
ncbi:hypothetical protein M409DRAFT_29490 [Zasmidium cellare ATCC 36951]|uniref:Uncharacterized protein n=1 Tax=Zasmidium cellare ATCC 36951 TaxID=1080233 RepID=A0A6A6C191_ZASCE|nr:uncharacterized protein M409DRAFT_29490 [Zasmidium cellare ATCC 36951]KAF2160038.1 hypothetical protein M409DRAFT_29490 [Zasmidium cellare ATCC 36951]